MTTILPETSHTTGPAFPCPTGVLWCNAHDVAEYIEGDEHTHYGKYSMPGVELLINHSGDPEPTDFPYVHIQVDGAEPIQGTLPDLAVAFTALDSALTGQVAR